MTEALHCFLDESGDPNFPPGEAGRSDHYVVGGIVMPEDRVDGIREAAESIRQEHFGDGEMKSNARALNRNPERRKALVEAIASLEVSFAVVAVDKRMILEDGPLAEWKRSFIKYTGGLLFRRLFATHDTVHIVADEHGTTAFQDEFINYVQARHIPTLFRGQSTFAFANSKNEPLVQIADVVVGTVFRALRDGSGENRALVGLFRPRLHTFISWPPVFAPVEPPLGYGEQFERDLRVREYALSQATRYLGDHRADEDPVHVARVATLDLLVFASQLDEGSSFVHADEILVHLKQLRLPFAFSKRWLSSEVIGPLRDDGVVITGSSRGYAIPYRASDLDAHALDVRSKAIPMLRRLSRYRSDLSMRTGGDIDLLASANLSEVRLLVETLDARGLDGHAT